jgi:AcrR family transcriptional regulator
MPEERAYHHGNLRRELLDAAIRLFAERGRFDFTMRELARAAGVTHNAPYRHFADRWALLDAIAADGFSTLRDMTERAAAPHLDDPRARIEHIGEAYVRFAGQKPEHFRLMFTRPLENASPELLASARASFKVLEDTIESARSAGLLRPGVKTAEATLAAWSLVHGFASLVVGGQVKASAGTRKALVSGLASVFRDGAFRSTRAVERPSR